MQRSPILILPMLVLAVLAGCSPTDQEPPKRSDGASWQTGDNTEVWSRCGPVAGDGPDCLSLARRYADGTQSNRPACMSEIGSTDDESLNNVWLTLSPNGADPAVFEQLRMRRLARFQAALAVAADPSADLDPARRQLFRADFTDCWNTYNQLRELNASPAARDDFLDMMERRF